MDRLLRVANGQVTENGRFKSGAFRLAKLGQVQILRKIVDLLWTIAVILVILWLLGMVSSYTLGGFVHILLVLAIVVVLIRVIQGRRPV